LKKILVAEDDMDLRNILHDLLTATGFNVVMAGDGRETLALVKQEKPDFLVLDLSMPEIDGWQVAHELRRSAATQTLPILALTAHAMVGDCERALKAGCDSFLAKPFMPEDLLIEIQRLMERRAASQKK
jgi:two-component system, cell cycle response regulator DivK